MDAPKSNFGAPEEGGRKWYCVPRFHATTPQAEGSHTYTRPDGREETVPMEEAQTVGLPSLPAEKRSGITENVTVHRFS